MTNGGRVERGLEAAKEKIRAHLKSVKGGVFTEANLSDMLAEHSREWGLTKRVSLRTFTEFLAEELSLRKVELRAEHYRRVDRFAWGEFSPYLMALSLRPRSYLSHGTAVFLNGLNDQLPKTIYVNQEQSEKRTARIAGVLLFVLAAYVVVVSALTLLGYSEPKTTYVGIAVLVAAAAIMPWLAKEKRKLSALTGSAALRADAAESALCAYLAFVALAGLGINAIWHLRWADPIAALVIVPLILREGWEAMRGKACGCS